MRHIAEYIARARSMPLHMLLLKVLSLIVRKARRTRSRVYFRCFSSFSTNNQLSLHSDHFQAPDLKWLLDKESQLQIANKYTLDHRFDLLGSGWVQVAYNSKVNGFEGVKYSSNLKNLNDSLLRKALHINFSNRAKSRKILKHISSEYKLIDWQLDFKSGYRWDNDCWWESIPYGHKAGVDIKVPWELSRMQHLPWLAYGFKIANSKSDKTQADLYLQEFKNQILDFIANNPPCFGVNWKCPMDVAIRAANWLMAYDLFQNSNAANPFDKNFIQILSNSLFDHGLFVEKNFEKSSDFRGNHFLADIAGLTFIAFYLTENPTVKRWRSLCLKYLESELDFQFLKSGANFEGSTAYHRLSSEMMIYPLFLVTAADKFSFNNNIENEQLKKLMGMSLFSQDMTRPDGNILQIGDNDSGRFFKLNPAWLNNKDELVENHLNVSHLSKTLDAFFYESETDIESSIIKKTLHSKRQKLSFKSESFRLNHEKNKTVFFEKNLEMSLESATQVYKYEFKPTQLDLKNMTSLCYKDFGIVVYKSEDFFLSFRCGPVGQMGRGGHDHNDQLSIELYYDNSYKIIDPGTYVYTPNPKERNRYRSNIAHFCPQVINAEMGNLNKGLFFIEKAIPGEIISFQKNSCLGLSYGFGFPIIRKISLSSSILIEDYFYSDSPVLDLKEFNNVAYSAGYGLKS